MIATRALGATALLLGALAAVVGSPAPPGQHSENEPLRISAAELAEWQHAKRSGLRVIDVRPADSFDASHIAGAEDIPLVSLVTTEFNHAETVVLYDDTETRVDQAWVLLRGRGLTRVYVLRGGLAKWPGGVAARRRGC